MPSAANETAGAEENPLHCEFTALGHIKDELGAESASVLVLRKGRKIDLLYHWPETAEVQTVRLGGNAILSKPSYLAPEALTPENPIGNWLKGLSPHVHSFLLFSSAAPNAEAVVAFGFSNGRLSRPAVRSEIASTVKLIALAAWRLDEVRRLRAELATVNERLRQRKLVERAKAQLQSQLGFTEQEAYEHLRKLSRQRRVPMAAVARSLIGSSMA